MKTTNPFKIPPGYFDELPAMLDDRIPDVTVTGQKNTGIVSMMAPALLLMVVGCLSLLSVYILWPQKPQVAKTVSYEQLYPPDPHVEILISYLQDEGFELILEEEFTRAACADTSGLLIIFPTADSKISGEDILQYLLEEQITYAEIYTSF